MLRIVYMGTPEIAAVVLKELLRSEHEVAAVITQPDRPKGRGRETAASPVKETALAAGVPVYQPEKVKAKEFVAVLKELKPDMIIVTAFGQILSQEILDIPPYGCINVHASLLPKYRGASPIQWAILNGEEKTGITIMYMDAGCDTGDMILKKEVAIGSTETAGSLHDKLAQAAGPVLLSAIASIEAKTAERIPQNGDEASYVKPLDKLFGKMDFTKPAAVLERLVRGLNPWPSAYTFYRGKLLKIWAAEVRKQEGKDAPCGTVLFTEQGELLVRTGEGDLCITELQLEGKKRMKTEAFLRGFPIEAGSVFGE